MASYSATDFPLLPHDELDVPFHENLISSWWLWHMIPFPLAYRFSYPLGVVGVAGLLRCIFVVRVQGQP